MARRYPSSAKKSNRKFKVGGAQQLAVQLPLPLEEL
jgi:hypothetical protein